MENTVSELTEKVTKKQDDKIEISIETESSSKTESEKEPIEIEPESKKDRRKANKQNKGSKIQVKVEDKKPLLSHETINVEVKRDPKIQVSRLKLPILGEEQRIMELINEHEFLIVAGETGN